MQTARVGESATIVLDPVERFSSGVHGFRIPLGVGWKDIFTGGGLVEGWMTIEVRQPDSRWNYPAMRDGGVLVRLTEDFTARFSRAETRLLDMIPESADADFVDSAIGIGKTFTDPWGLTVKALQKVGDAVQVQVTVPREYLDTPHIFIRYPAEDEVFHQRDYFIVSNHCFDDTGCVQARYYWDGKLLGTHNAPEDDGSSFYYSWDTTQEQDGPHTVEVRALDADGNEGSSSVTVLVDNTPPVATITTPANGAVVYGAVPVKFEARDAQGLFQARLSLDGTVVKTIQPRPFVSFITETWTWDATTAQDGSHELQVKAEDRAGNQHTSAVQVTVVSQFSYPLSVKNGINVISLP